MDELSTNSGLTYTHLLDSLQSITKLPWQLSFNAKRIVCQMKVHKITHKIFWEVTAQCRLQMFCFSFNNVHFKRFPCVK